MEDSMSDFGEHDITCLWTVKTCALLSLDAVCCLPCCCFCGGCCGKYAPCVASSIPSDGNIFSKTAGSDRCLETCTLQTIASMLMPLTLCGCLWGACGLATPCARGALQKVMSRDRAASAGTIPRNAVAPTPEPGMQSRA